jgi:hypothetical protein
MVLPSEHVIRFVIQQTASLQHHLGDEIGRRALVLPNGRFFPDRFTGDSASLAVLMRRIQEHAGLTDVPIQTRIVGDTHGNSSSDDPQGASTNKSRACKGDCGGKGCAGCDGSCHDQAKPEGGSTAAAQGCGSGCGSSCGTPEDFMGDEPRLVDLGDGWRVQVPANELTQPLVLTTNLARAIGYIFLVETRSPKSPVHDNLDVAADLASTLLGFGALLLTGSYIYSKSCGGPRIRRVTSLGCAELAIATVMFASRHEQDLRPMRKDLEATQKAAVDEASLWFKERPLILDRFVSDPQRLARGEVPMAKGGGGLVARFFGKRVSAASAADDPESNLCELEAMLAESPLATSATRNARPDPRADELRALVDEALSATGSQIR